MSLSVADVDDTSAMLSGLSNLLDFSFVDFQDRLTAANWTAVSGITRLDFCGIPREFPGGVVWSLPSKLKPQLPVFTALVNLECYSCFVPFSTVQVLPSLATLICDSLLLPPVGSRVRFPVLSSLSLGGFQACLAADIPAAQPQSVSCTFPRLLELDLQRGTFLKAVWPYKIEDLWPAGDDGQLLQTRQLSVSSTSLSMLLAEAAVGWGGWSTAHVKGV